MCNVGLDLQVPPELLIRAEAKCLTSPITVITKQHSRNQQPRHLIRMGLVHPTGALLLVFLVLIHTPLLLVVLWFSSHRFIYQLVSPLKCSERGERSHAACT